MKKSRLVASVLLFPVVVGMLACGGDEDSSSAPPSTSGGAAGAAAGGSAGKAGGSAGSAAGKGGSSGATSGGSAGQTTGGSAGQAAAGTGGAAGQATGGAAGQATGGAAVQATGGAAGQATGGAAGQVTGGAAGQATGGAAGQTTGGAAGQTAGGAAGSDAGGSAGMSAAGSAGAGGNGDPGVKQACSALAVAQCQKREECLADQPTRIWGAGGLKDCIDGLTAQCVDITKDPSTLVKPADRLTCAKATEKATCEEWRASGPLPGCEPVPGADDTGAACTFDTECKSAYCQRGRDASCGKCAPLPVDGADCTVYDCGQQALSCQASLLPNGPSQTCQKRGVAGDACAKQSDCEDTFRCTTGDVGLKKFCQLARQLDEFCDADVDCDQRLGLFCKPGNTPVAKSKCAAAPVGGAGDACGAKAQNALCGKGTSCVAGLCVKYASLTEACSTSAGPECLPFATCVRADALAAPTCVQLTEAVCK